MANKNALYTGNRSSQDIQQNDFTQESHTVHDEQTYTAPSAPRGRMGPIQKKRIHIKRIQAPTFKHCAIYVLMLILDSYVAKLEDS
jgi:hypothetical protein